MEPIQEVIRKEGDEIVLYSADGKKVLGRFPFGEGKKYADEETARAAAEKRERQIQYFKHKGEALEEALHELREKKHSAAWHRCWETVQNPPPPKTPRGKQRTGLDARSAAALCTWSLQKPPNPPDVYEAEGEVAPTGVVTLTLDDAWEVDEVLAASMEATGLEALQIDLETWEIAEVPGEGGEMEEITPEAVAGMLEKRGKVQPLAEVGAKHTSAEIALIDKIVTYLRVIRDGEITADEAAELAALGINVKPTAAPQQEAAPADSFENRSDEVYGAWRALYPWQDGVKQPDVVGTYEGYVIARDGAGYFQVAYQADGAGKITLADRTTWVPVEMTWTPAGESNANLAQSTAVQESAELETANLEYTIALHEAAVDGAGNLDCVLIEAGESANGNVYSPEVLEAALPHFVGAQMFVDHPARSEEKDRPERSVRDLAGRITEAHYADGKIRARARLSQSASWLKILVREGVAGDLSINAVGQGRKDGARFVVEAITGVRSVDFVTKAAARGRVLEVLEAEGRPPEPDPWAGLTIEQLAEHRPDILNELASREKDKLYRGKEETLREAEAAPALREELGASKKRVEELQAQLEARAVGDVVEQQLRESNLPAPAQASIRKQMEGVSLADAPAKLAALIQEQKELVAALLEAGRVRGHGGSESAPDGEKARAELVAAFVRAGLTEAEAEAAARGRGK